LHIQARRYAVMPRVMAVAYALLTPCYERDSRGVRDERQNNERYSRAMRREGTLKRGEAMASLSSAPRYALQARQRD